MKLEFLLLTMLLLFGLTGCAACSQRNTETTEINDTETTETITEPETSIETNITNEVETTDEGLSSSDTNTSDEPETTEEENLTIESNGTGVDGVSDEEVQAEIDEAPVVDISEEDRNSESFKRENGWVFNGVQYGSSQEYWKAVNEYEAANDPDVYTPDEFDEILNW
mgnify:FL=1